jgi:hypothetical protein
MSSGSDSPVPQPQAKKSPFIPALKEQGFQALLRGKNTLDGTESPLLEEKLTDLRL